MKLKRLLIITQFFKAELIFCILSMCPLLIYGQKLSVTGITSHTDANGIYIKQGTKLNSKDYWKHEVNEYYIYYGVTFTPYWNIDNDKVDDNPNTNEDVLFFVESSTDKPPESGWGSSVSNMYTFGEGDPQVVELTPGL